MSTMTIADPTPGTETFPADHRRARLHGRVALVTGGGRHNMTIMTALAAALMKPNTHLPSISLGS